MSTEDYAQTVFEGKDEDSRACVFCAGIHDTVTGLNEYYQPCPRVKRITRSENGSILELEFWAKGEWEGNVVFPSDVYNEETED